MWLMPSLQASVILLVDSINLAGRPFKLIYVEKLLHLSPLGVCLRFSTACFINSGDKLQLLGHMWLP